MVGDLLKTQTLQKYPFRKSKGLFSRGFILVTNLLVDVLVKKSVALCQCIIRKSQERVDSPEQIFHRSFSLGAPAIIVLYFVLKKILTRSGPAFCVYVPCYNKVSI